MTIAVIGYNRLQSIEAVRVLAENDCSPIERVYNHNVFLKDGTIYVPIISDDAYLRGVRFDQIIYVDDYRWNVFSRRYDVIKMIRSCLSGLFSETKYEEQRYEW